MFKGEYAGTINTVCWIWQILTEAQKKGCRWKWSKSTLLGSRLQIRRGEEATTGATTLSNSLLVGGNKKCLCPLGKVYIVTLLQACKFASCGYSIMWRFSVSLSMEEEWNWCCIIIFFFFFFFIHKSSYLHFWDSPAQQAINEKDLIPCTFFLIWLTPPNSWYISITRGGGKGCNQGRWVSMCVQSCLLMVHSLTGVGGVMGR